MYITRICVNLAFRHKKSDFKNHSESGNYKIPVGQDLTWYFF